MLVVPLLAAMGAEAASSPGPPGLVVNVVDENGVAVPAAQVTLTSAAGQTAQGETDYAGRCQFARLPPGPYQLRVAKEGFFEFIQKDFRAGETHEARVTLNHQRELVERVNVIYSPPLIDPQKTVSSHTLTSREIIDLPYNVPRDVRYALPMLPGVLQDGTGQIHVDGSDTPQILDVLDGFNISAPGSGLLILRVNTEALRSVSVLDSRYPAEYGQGSGGVLSLITGMGDDRFRFAGTDFLPSLENRRGWHIGTWTPRGALSGPIRRDKAWFLVAPEGEYHTVVITDLPPNADRGTVWRLGNLAKAQVNLRPGNTLFSSFLINRFRSDHAGLTRFNPLDTTLDLNQEATLVALKDQDLLASGVLAEVGLAQSFFDSGSRPMGIQPYVISPNGTSGNYFETSQGRSSRLEGIASLILPATGWHGRHELKMGTDLDRLTFHQAFERRPLSIVRADGTLARRIVFDPTPPFNRNNFEAGVYVQDRWSLSGPWLVEPGLRLDWDEIVREVLPQPRLASTYLLRRGGETKLVGGIGLYADRTNINLVTQPQWGTRTDYFYSATGGALAGPPVETRFVVNPREIEAPRFLNWSAGVERKLPGELYTQLEFIGKQGHDAPVYVNSCRTAADCFSGVFRLENIKRDRYHAAEVSVRRSFRGGHLLFASYTRSAARSNAVFNFNVENPVFSPQAAGPLPWDTPNRFLSWGFLPLVRGFDLAYTLDWHSGSPFSVVNQNQQLVGAAGSHRFPTYFSLNLALETKLHVFGYLWSLRAGFNDITNRHNPFAVDNNIDSPHFLAFSAIQERSLTARIRLLGRK